MTVSFLKARKTGVGFICPILTGTKFPFDVKGVKKNIPCSIEFLRLKLQRTVEANEEKSLLSIEVIDHAPHNLLIGIHE